MESVIYSKICKKCNILKPLEDFHRDGMGKYKRKSWCKICVKQKDAIQYIKDREKELSNCKIWRKNNELKVIERRERYKINHPNYFINHYNKNKIKIRNKVNKRYQERMELDINFKLTKQLRSRIYSAVKHKFKAGSAIRDLGYTIEEFKIYLSIFFYDNPETGEKMTWDNHNYLGWHTDHIKPLASFDLNNRKQFLEATHFTNLQPLWRKDNLSKSNKTDSSCSKIIDLV